MILATQPVQSNYHAHSETTIMNNANVVMALRLLLIVLELSIGPQRGRVWKHLCITHY